MSLTAASWATWTRIGWLAAAVTASACWRTISTPLQPRHSPWSPQWQSWRRRRSRAAWTSERSTEGLAMAFSTSLQVGAGRPVHGLDEVAMALLDHPALDRQLGGQLACLLGEVAGQESEVLDGLEAGPVSVD